MAQFVHQYVQQLVLGQAQAAQMLNVNLYGVSHEQWVQLLVIDTVVGVVMKALSDFNPVVFTDAAWVNALNHALDQSVSAPWPVNLINQVDPNQTPGV